MIDTCLRKKINSENKEIKRAKIELCRGKENRIKLGEHGKNNKQILSFVKENSSTALLAKV